MTFKFLPATAAILAVALSACATPDPEPPAPEITRSDNAALLDTAALACLEEAIYHEAAANNLDGGLAVAHVILNRANDPRFPNTVCDVIAEGEDRGRCQFSYRCDGLAEVVTDRRKHEGAIDAIQALLENPSKDVTDGALFFHATWMPPGWFATLRETVTLGGNIFYREA